MYRQQLTSGGHIVHATQDELKKIANCAHLDLDADDEVTLQLAKDINTIMDYIGQLKGVDTQNITPLIHPLDKHQLLRSDNALENDFSAELAQIAPLFSDNLYLVPKVINTGN